MTRRQWEIRWADYYEVLGVQFDAAQGELKEAFNIKAQMTHPDMHVGKSERVNAEATRQFAKLSEAFECLRDETARHHYDRAWLSRNLRYYVHIEPTEVDLGMCSAGGHLRLSVTVGSDISITPDLGATMSVKPNPPLTEACVLQVDARQHTEASLFPLALDIVLAPEGVGPGEVSATVDVTFSFDG